jgi:hypothetical protein
MGGPTHTIAERSWTYLSEKAAGELPLRSRAEVRQSPSTHRHRQRSDSLQLSPSGV